MAPSAPPATAPVLALGPGAAQPASATASSTPALICATFSFAVILSNRFIGFLFTKILVINVARRLYFVKPKLFKFAFFILAFMASCQARWMLSQKAGR